MKKRLICSIILPLLAAAILSFALPANKITVYLAGDSTMSVKEISAYPETGWGMPFSTFFDSTVNVKNIARNGRSTKTFIKEGLWKSISDNLKPGDYVFIQFGHNDEVPQKVSYTPTADFKANLSLFIKEVKAKNAVPILLTPVARRKFNPAGMIVATHEVYSGLIRETASTQHVVLIDLDKASQELIQKYGVETSKMLFNHLAPGEHPNYPDGKTDDTHFNELGARKIAELVLNDIKQKRLDLAERIVKGQHKPVVNPQVK